MRLNVRNGHGMLDLEKSLHNCCNEIRKKDILQYNYPSEKEMDDANLKITFLGYFWKDWSLIDNGNFSALRGLDIRNEPPTDLGDHVGITSLDENWVTLNQMIKYLKFGLGLS